jgi:hypothetical protein
MQRGLCGPRCSAITRSRRRQLRFRSKPRAHGAPSRSRHRVSARLSERISGRACRLSASALASSRPAGPKIKRFSNGIRGPGYDARASGRLDVGREMVVSRIGCFYLPTYVARHRSLLRLMAKTNRRFRVRPCLQGRYFGLSFYEPRCKLACGLRRLRTQRRERSWFT